MGEGGSCSTVFNPTYGIRSPHEVQYAVPELFSAPHEGQDETERVKLESVGVAHISEDLVGLFVAFAAFLSILFFAELSKLLLTQEEILLINPGPFCALIACSSTIVLIP